MIHILLPFYYVENKLKGVKHKLPYYIEKERKVIIIPAIYKNNVKYGGSSSSANIDTDKFAQKVELTLAEYEALGDSVKTDGILYFITDAEPTQDGSVNTDAETLGGYSADDFAKTTDLANYLPLTGGILTNGLGVANGYASLNGDENAVILGTTSTVDGSGNARLFRVFNPEYTSATAQIVDIIDGVHTAYDVVHSGNIADYACTTSVADVDKTSITSFTTSTISGTLTSQVKNGVAYITVCPIKNSEIVSDIEVCELPISNIEVNLPLISNTGGEYVGMFWMNADSGKLMARFFKASANGYATFSYPVKEN